MIASACELAGSVIFAIAEPAMSTTGTSAVNTLTPKLGISSSVNTFGLYSPSGIAGLRSLTKL